MEGVHTPIAKSCLCIPLKPLSWAVFKGRLYIMQSCLIGLRSSQIAKVPATSRTFRPPLQITRKLQQVLEPVKTVDIWCASHPRHHFCYSCPHGWIRNPPIGDFLLLRNGGVNAIFADSAKPWGFVPGLTFSLNP